MATAPITPIAYSEASVSRSCAKISTSAGTPAANTAPNQGAPNPLSFCRMPGSSRSRDITYMMLISPFTAVLVADRSSAPPMMRTGHSPQAPT